MLGTWFNLQQRKKCRENREWKKKEVFVEYVLEIIFLVYEMVMTILRILIYIYFFIFILSLQMFTGVYSVSVGFPCNIYGKWL